MRFSEFISTPKHLAMVITIEQYWQIRELLYPHYDNKALAHIDDYCRFKWSSTKFLLCNPAERGDISTAMMLENAVTFVERIPFAKINFEE